MYVFVDSNEILHDFYHLNPLPTSNKFFIDMLIHILSLFRLSVCCHSLIYVETKNKNVNRSWINKIVSHLQGGKQNLIHVSTALVMAIKFFFKKEKILLIQ